MSFPIKAHSMAFGRVLLQQRSSETPTRTCTILQETINRFLCPIIVFLKSKTHQLNLKDVTELNRNLR